MKIPVGKGGLVHMTHDIFIHKSNKKGKRRTSENKSFNFSTRIFLFRSDFFQKWIANVFSDL